MSELLATTLGGLGDPGVPQRTASTWLRESTAWIALLATRRTFTADPALWRLGEQGRARTMEDFTHHLRALLGGDAHWRKHLDYTVRLFDARGFPQRWLLEAFTTLREVLRDTFPAELIATVDARLALAPELLRELAAAAEIDLARPTSYDRARG